MVEIKNDFIYFKNEVLEDIKSIEKKINSKITSLTKDIEKINQNSENQSQLITTKFTEISNYIQERTTFNELRIEIQNLSNQTSNQNTIFSTKISSIEKDLSDTCYKYDQMILNNIIIPGLIGDKCKFKNLKELINYIYQSVKQFATDREKRIKEINELKTKINNFNNKLSGYLLKIKTEISELIITHLQEYDIKVVKENSEILEKISNLKIENESRYLELKEKIENFQKNKNKNEENPNIKNYSEDKNNNEVKDENNFEIQKMKKKIDELDTIISDIKVNISEKAKNKNDKKIDDKIQRKKSNENNSLSNLNMGKMESFIKTYLIKNNFEIKQKEKAKNNSNDNKNNLYSFKKNQNEKRINENSMNRNNRREKITKKLLNETGLLEKSNNKEIFKENIHNIGVMTSNDTNNNNEENSYEKSNKIYRERLPSITMNDKLDSKIENENLSKNNSNRNIIQSPKNNKTYNIDAINNSSSNNILDNKINKINEELLQFKTILLQVVNKLNINNINNKENKIEKNNLTERNYNTVKKRRTLRLSNYKESNNNCSTDKSGNNDKKKRSIQYIINLQKEFEKKDNVNERNKTSNLFRYMNNSDNIKKYYFRTSCEDNKNIINQNNIINSSYNKISNVDILKKIEPFLIKQFRK